MAKQVKFTGPSGLGVTNGAKYDVLRSAHELVYVLDDDGDTRAIFPDEYEPCDPPSTESPTPPQTPGLTARQWYAGCAIMGLNAGRYFSDPHEIAEHAKAQADAMLAAEKGGES